MDSRSSSSSSRLSDSETDVSTFSTPSSSTTSFDSIVTATYHAVSSTPNLHYSHDSTKYSPRSDISCDLSQTAFDQAYQLYAQTSHMGILDPAYTVFNSEHGYGSLVYKIQARTIIVTGDPLCSEQNLRPLLDELDHFRASRNLALVFVSMSEDFVKHCEKDWDTIQFGCDRVLNPLANKILQGKGNKRMISQNKQLLDPKRGNLKVRLYSPSVTGIDIKLQNQIQALYDDWRYERNKCHKGNSQAFITVYDLFSHPDLTAFLYVSDSKNTIKGFATLRALGGHHGFHLDPCIASPDAPRGVTDLLVVSAMQLLNTAGINYMSLGFEPLDGVQMMNSERKLHSWVWKHSYDRVMKSSTLSGKAAYFKKFYPDDSLASKLFLCIPKKRIPVRESLALLKYANIDIKQVLTKRTST